MAPVNQTAKPNGQSPSIFSNLGLSRIERAIGVLLFTIVVGGLVQGKLDATEAATMLVALTGVAAAISAARKTGAEAADTYASAAQKASEQNNTLLDMNNALQERLNSFEASERESREEINSLRKSLNARESRVKALEEQNERMKKRLDEKDNLLKAHQEQLNRLTEAVLQKDARIQELEALGIKQNNEIARQKDEIAALRSEIEQLRSGK